MPLMTINSKTTPLVTKEAHSWDSTVLKPKVRPRTQGLLTKVVLQVLTSLVQIMIPVVLPRRVVLTMIAVVLRSISPSNLRNNSNNPISNSPSLISSNSRATASSRAMANSRATVSSSNNSQLHQKYQASVTYQVSVDLLRMLRMLICSSQAMANRQPMASRQLMVSRQPTASSNSLTSNKLSPTSSKLSLTSSKLSPISNSRATANSNKLSPTSNSNKPSPTSNSRATANSRAMANSRATVNSKPMANSNPTVNSRATPSPSLATDRPSTANHSHPKHPQHPKNSTHPKDSVAAAVEDVVDLQEEEEAAQEPSLHGLKKKTTSMTSLKSHDSMTSCQSLIKRRVRRAALPTKRAATSPIRCSKHSLTPPQLNLTRVASVKKVVFSRDSSVQTTRRLAATKQLSVLCTEETSESILTTVKSQAGEIPA